MWRKEIVEPSRIRKLPEGFGWVDHRLAREGLIGGFGPEALALYLFLVAVADAEGVSWYSDASLRRRLSLAPSRLDSARGELVAGGLVAYRKPHYQVLELPCARASDGFRMAVETAAAARVHPAPEWRQPLGTEGMGVSLHPAASVYRRGEGIFDALPVSAVLGAMFGGAK